MNIPEEKKVRFWVRIAFLALSLLLFLVSITSCNFVTLESLKGAAEAYPNDHPVEEVIEEAIQYKWGWDVDLSFWDGKDPF